MSKNRDKFAEGVAQATSIRSISKLAQEARMLEVQIASVDAKREELQKQLNVIKIVKLPAMMAEAGMPSFSLEDGTEVEIKEFCSGSLPKDEAKRKAAIEWLMKNGGASLIKTELGLSFGKTEAKKAQQIIKLMKKAGVDPSVVTGVHPQTLQAFARERLENGDDIDLDKLGLYAGKIAKFKLPGDR